MQLTYHVKSNFGVLLKGGGHLKAVERKTERLFHFSGKSSIIIFLYLR